jgi:hypothetical protein
LNWDGVHRRVEELKHKLHRAVKPHDIVKDAASPESVYHNFFEWDDRKAGPKFRLQQARHLLQSLRVIYHDPEGKRVSVRKYIRVILSKPADTELRSGYVPRMEVIKTPRLKEQVVEMARQALESFKVRFRLFPEIEAVFPHVDAAILMLSGRKTKKKRGAAV